MFDSFSLLKNVRRHLKKTKQYDRESMLNQGQKVVGMVFVNYNQSSEVLHPGKWNGPCMGAWGCFSIRP